MSLVKTFAKVAAGVVVAKAVKGAMGGGRRGASQSSMGGGIEDMLGQVLGGGGGRSSGRGGSGLDDMLGQVLGGGTGRGGSGGLDDILGQVLGKGGAARGGQGGSLQDMLGQVMAGRAGAGAGSGGLGGILDDLSQMSRQGGAPDVTSQQTGGSFGSVLNQSLERFGDPQEAPTREQEDLAGVLLRAMVQAAKADGQIDGGEQSRLLEHMGDVSQQEMAFVEAELRRPVDIEGLARDVPRGAEQQVYMVSALAIEIDQQSEARYLHALARAMGLNAQTVNAIHDRIGAPRILS